MLQLAFVLLSGSLSILLAGCAAAGVRSACLPPHATNQVLDALGRRGWNKVSVADLSAVRLDKSVESWPPIPLPSASNNNPSACTGKKTFFSDQVVVDGLTECGITFSFSFKQHPGGDCAELLDEIRIRYASHRHARVSQAIEDWLDTVRNYSGALIQSKSGSRDKQEYYREDGSMMLDGTITPLNGKWVGEVTVLFLGKRD